MVMTAPTQFNFSVNNIETMSLDTLRRTHKENDIYGQPVKGIYHYEVIQRMADLCEKHNLNYEVEEIFAAQNKNKNQPGVVVLPQVEREFGVQAVEAHILRRIYTTIRINDWETDELTTTLVVAFHQDGIQAAIGPCIGKCCFETDWDVPQAMLDALGPKALTAITQKGDDRHSGIQKSGLHMGLDPVQDRQVEADS